jgi:hypothetical protein
MPNDIFSRRHGNRSPIDNSQFEGTPGTGGASWQSMTIDSNRRQSTAIDSNRQQSTAIDSNRRQ